MAASPSQQFTQLIIQLLRQFGYDIFNEDATKELRSPIYQPDLVIRKDDFETIVELKFYRSQKADPSLLFAAAAQLHAVRTKDQVQRLLIISNYAPLSMRSNLFERYGVVLWDRSNLVNFMREDPSGTLLETFRQLVFTGQQGTDTADPFGGVIETDSRPEKYFESIQISRAPVIQVPKQGEALIGELEKIAPGNTDWSRYEKTCTLILQYLFRDDLTIWEQQQTTDDELSRFDLVCRILPRDDFWKALIASFQSRFVLFEFKNYTDPIKQGQIYSTERYLFPKALRSVAFILSRKEPSSQAIIAAKGALREHGKLILLLSDDDLKAMLQKRDQGGAPNDSLGEKLDDFLLSLSR